MDENGEGVLQSFEQTLKWFSQAAANVSSTSQYHLG